MSQLHSKIVWNGLASDIMIRAFDLRVITEVS